MRFFSTRRDEFRGLEPLESRQMLAGDLAIDLTGLTGPANPSSGTIRVDANIVNAGDRFYRGGGQVHYFLSTDAVLDASDLGVSGRAFSGVLTPGAGIRVQNTLRVSDLLRAGASGTYFVLARVTPNAEGFDSNTANDADSSAGTITLGDESMGGGSSGGSSQGSNSGGSSGGSGGGSSGGSNSGSNSGSGGEQAPVVRGAAGRLFALLRRSNGGGSSGGSSGGGSNSGGGSGSMLVQAPPPNSNPDYSISLSAVQNPYDSRDRREELRTTATIRNVGDVVYRGRGTIEYYFSTDGTLDTAADFLFHTQDVDALPTRGRSKDFRLDIAEPKLINPPAPLRAVPAAEYQVIARLVLADSAFDTNADNNAAPGSGVVDVDYLFGRVGERDNVQITTTLSNGTEATFAIDRVGIGRVSMVDGRMVVEVANTELNASLLIRTARNAVVPISQIILTSAMQAFKAPNSVITGSIIVDDMVREIIVGGMSGLINLGVNRLRGLSMNLGNVNDLVINSNAVISDLNVNSWRNTDASPDSIIAPTVSRISSGGDFDANVTTSRRNSNSHSIDHARVGGAARGIWNVDIGMETFEAGSTGAGFRANVDGPLTNLLINGNFGGIFAAQEFGQIRVTRDMIGGTILAGADLGNDAALGGTGVNADTFATSFIDSVDIRGSMVNSIVASGLRTTDATLLDDDDTFAPNGPSRIRSVQVRRSMDSSSSFVAEQFQNARIANRDVDIQNDARFVLTLPPV